MEENKVTSHIVKGLIIGLILIVLTLVVQFMGLKRDSWPVQMLSICILAGGIIWSCWIYGKQKNNFVTFGNLFGHGFKTTAVITTIIVIFLLIFFLGFPQFKEEAIEQSRQQMEEGGKMSDEQIEQAMDVTKRFFMLFVIGSIIFFYAILGAIASLIGAAVTKKKPVNPFNQSGV